MMSDAQELARITDEVSSGERLSSNVGANLRAVGSAVRCVAHEHHADVVVPRAGGLRTLGDNLEPTLEKIKLVDCS
jgi:hypothetical protein